MTFEEIEQHEKTINSLPPIKKGYEIPEFVLCKPWFYTGNELHCVVESVGKAKKILLNNVYEFGITFHRFDEITYLNIPIRRCEEIDLVLWEGEEVTRNKIIDIIQEKERKESLNNILKNTEITHCYIAKGGSYYADNHCGYVSMRSRAGVYTKEDAVSSGRHCRELDIIPINTIEHNKMVDDEIERLKNRLI